MKTAFHALVSVVMDVFFHKKKKNSPNTHLGGYVANRDF